MNIIVVGCGKVGMNLAEQLNSEGHEITLIDKDRQKLEYAVASLDLMGVCGNGTSFHTLKEAGIAHAHLLIAVTNQDEINLLSCLIAKKAGNCQTIARVRNPEYYEEIQFLKKELELSMTINPEREAASNIARLIQIPSAMDVDTFAKGRLNLIHFIIPSNSVLNGMKISEFPAKISHDVLICAMQRNEKIIIPDGSCTLMEGDRISIFIPLREIAVLFDKMGIKTKPIKSVMIAGGGTLSFYLASQLCKSRVKVKIIEINKARCEFLSEQLPEAMIIHGDATNQQVLLEEGIDRMDAFVALTNMDEENILLALYVNKISNAKLITKINKISFEEVIKEMPIGSVICPKNITAEYIIQYVRAMQNSVGSNVETLYRMMNNRVEALEFVVRENKEIVDIPLMELNLKDELLICCINRGGRMITPTGKDVIKVGDTVIIVTTKTGLKDLSDILRS